MGTNQNVNYTFKLLYAIGIVFVVAGHCPNLGYSHETQMFPIYSFHMGLFMFVSGYFYTSKNEENVPGYIIKKLKHLILPLYLWNFLYAFLVEILQEFGFTIGEHVNLRKLFLEPIYSGHQFGYNLAGWFVIPLFMIQIFNIILRKTASALKVNIKEPVYFIISYIMGLIGIILTQQNLNTGWWVVLVRFLTLIPFYGIGILYKKYEKYDKSDNLAYFSIIFIIALILIYIFNEMPIYVYAWGSLFKQGYLIPHIVGFLGIAFWLRVAKILTPAIGRDKYVNIIANNTFPIMINHLFGFMIVKSVFSFIHKKTSFAAGFNMEAYKNDLWYYYLPHNLPQMYIIYIVFGLLFSVVTGLAVSKTSSLLVKLLKKCYNFARDKKELYNEKIYS